MDSVWLENSNIPKFNNLEHDIKTNVLIIGGGIAGVLCAYMLEQAGIDYILVEANIICSGITKNTTAKITSQHGLIYNKLINEFGVDKTKLYLRANEEALKKYCDLCNNIDCDFEKKDSFVYSVNDKNKINKELTALKK